MDWEKELDDVFKRSERGSWFEVQELFDKIMSMMTDLMILFAGCSFIHSPYMRNRLKSFLREEGFNEGQVDGFIYQIIEETTRPLIIQRPDIPWEAS